MESGLDVKDFIEIIAAINFIFEELVVVDVAIDSKHLLHILEAFFNVKDVTKEYQKYLPHTQLKNDEWDIINEFIVIDKAHAAAFPIIQIDMYEARESCCGPKYKEVMKKLPDSKDFISEIKNVERYGYGFVR